MQTIKNDDMEEIKELVSGTYMGRSFMVNGGDAMLPLKE
jgi:hypothetical protein